MVTPMKFFKMTTACKAALLAIATSLFATAGFAANHSGDPAVTHLAFKDSSKKYLVNIRGQLMDSLAITNLTNAPTHYDNDMSVRQGEHRLHQPGHQR